MTATRTATLHRLVLPDHICPFGVHAKQLLEQAGYTVDDQQLTTRAAVDAFKEQEGVPTTPVTFIDGTRYATSEALAIFLETASAD
ncbi:glutaredoxin domain-containing protein [Sphingomonas sp.]|uniref:glutaredoxin domain-containing protein n=1 Tax=Sphingomonas sp. TaxID=28214 RepID=UPI00286B3EE6|nr:glutaredoxin domain-containing protein [Sphingomonas sp.]